MGKKKVALETPEELTGWENVMLAALSLEGASGWETGVSKSVGEQVASSPYCCGGGGVRE